MEAKRQKVLFVGLNNADVTQIAEALLQTIYGCKYEVYSAGIYSGRVSMQAIQTMAKIGIDLTWRRAKSIDEFRNSKFDYVVTVGNHLAGYAAYFPESKTYLRADFAGVWDEAVRKSDGGAELAKARDAIRAWLEAHFAG